jgi:predicted transcriptional regulator
MAPAISLLAAHRLSSGQVYIIGGGSRGGAGFVYSRSGKESHATTMASTMELCAELHGLRGERVYKRSGDEILKSVVEEEVGLGVVWEPYLEIARRRGLRVDPCEAPFCCLLGAHRDLEGESSRLGRTLAQAISEARAGRMDLQAYSRLVGLPYDLVRRTVESYEFLEEAPIDEISRIMGVLRKTILPDTSSSQAVLK